MELRTPNNNGGNPTTDPKPDPESLHEDDKTQQHTHESQVTSSFFDEIDSTCSTPYVSAPSSPGRGSGNGGFYYSAPASPMHFVLTSSYAVMSPDNKSGGGGGGGLGFEFGSGSGANGSWMSSADELFLNGKIRPMKLSTHLEKPQVLAPLLDLENEEEEENEQLVSRGRDLRVSRDKPVRRRTRSLSPLRSTFSKWNHKEIVEEEDNEKQKQEQKQQHKSAFSSSLEVGMKPNKEIHEAEAEAEAASLSASSSRSSSVGGSRSTSKRWVFLKDFLRSKSEGRSNNKYFWLPTKEKKQPANTNTTTRSSSKEKDQPISPSISTSTSSVKKNKPVNGILTGKKRRVPPPSPHELHYTANRAQAEEMKKKTFLPYKQGLLGCLGFTSKGYGAMNGFARALNPVSSR
ncbi:hypothetical protein Ddye_026852 [Dipteronia dyeriana]|uniref:Uncharacterized protein n=1 Tax=Dipteronia dyeriana TaxID=168575 RepID=A0AAD9TNH4_9ROSI|nr:hypothetical protein Ddye_026852 [Dipteronia dyeriana]